MLLVRDIDHRVNTDEQELKLKERFRGIRICDRYIDQRMD